jgi:hypothetical protein
MIRSKYSQFFYRNPIIPKSRLIQPPSDHLPSFPFLRSSSSDERKKKKLFWKYPKWQSFYCFLSKKLQYSPLLKSSVFLASLNPAIKQTLFRLDERIISADEASTSILSESHRLISLSDLFSLDSVSSGASSSSSSSSVPVNSFPAKISHLSPLLSDSLLIRSFRTHIIPLHHEKIKYLLSLSSDEIFSYLLRTIEELRLEITRERVSSTSSTVEEELHQQLQQDEEELTTDEAGEEIEISDEENDQQPPKQREELLDKEKENKSDIEEFNDFLENDKLAVFAKSFLNASSFFSALAPSLSSLPSSFSSASGSSTSSSSSSGRIKKVNSSNNLRKQQQYTSKTLSRQSSRNNSFNHLPLLAKGEKPHSFIEPSSSSSSSFLKKQLGKASGHSSSFTFPSASSTATSTSSSFISSQYLPKVIQVDTNCYFSLPPFDLTYSLFYAIYHLKDSLSSPSYQLMMMKLITKWLAFIDNKGIFEMKRILLKSSSWQGNSLKICFATVEEGNARESIRDRSKNNQSKDRSFTEKERRTGAAVSVNRENITDIRRYLDVLSDILSFYVMLKGNFFQASSSSSLAVEMIPYSPTLSAKGHLSASVSSSTTNSEKVPSHHLPSFLEAASTSETMKSSISSTTSTSIVEVQDSPYHFNYLPFRLVPCFPSVISANSSGLLSPLASPDVHDEETTERKVKREIVEKKKAEDEEERILNAIIVKYSSLLHLDFLMILSIQRQWKSCISSLLEVIVELLGINIDELMNIAEEFQQRRRVKEVENKRITEVEEARHFSTPSKPLLSGSQLKSHVSQYPGISPKKRLFSPFKSPITAGKDRFLSSKDRHSLSSSVSYSFSHHSCNPAFYSPDLTSSESLLSKKKHFSLPLSTSSSSVSTNSGPSSSISSSTYNPRIHKMITDLLFPASSLSSSSASPSSPSSLSARDWIHSPQLSFLSKFYFLKEQCGLTFFIFILYFLMESNSWLSLELMIHHYYSFIPPFLIKFLLFEDDQEIIHYDKKRITLLPTPSVPSSSSFSNLFSASMPASSEQQPRRRGVSNVGITTIIPSSHEFVIFVNESNDLNLLLYYFDYLTKLIRHHYPASSSLSSRSPQVSNSSLPILSQDNTLSKQTISEQGSGCPSFPHLGGSFLIKFAICCDSDQVLMSLLDNRRKLRSKGRLLINEWLELSLFLSNVTPIMPTSSEDLNERKPEVEPTAAKSSNSAGNGFSSYIQERNVSPPVSSSSSFSWKKTASVVVKSIVNCDRCHYDFDFFDAMIVCLFFNELDGFLQIFQKYCNQRKKETEVDNGQESRLVLEEREDFDELQQILSCGIERILTELLICTSRAHKEKAIRQDIALETNNIEKETIIQNSVIIFQDHISYYQSLVERFYRFVLDYLLWFFAKQGMNRRVNEEVTANNNESYLSLVIHNLFVLPVLRIINQEASPNTEIVKELLDESLVISLLVFLLELFFDQVFVSAASFSSSLWSLYFVEKIRNTLILLLTSPSSPSLMRYLPFPYYLFLRQESSCLLNSAAASLEENTNPCLRDDNVEVSV